MTQPKIRPISDAAVAAWVYLAIAGLAFPPLWLLCWALMQWHDRPDLDCPVGEKFFTPEKVKIIFVLLFLGMLFFIHNSTGVRK